MQTEYAKGIFRIAKGKWQIQPVPELSLKHKRPQRKQETLDDLLCLPTKLVAVTQTLQKYGIKSHLLPTTVISHFPLSTKHPSFVLFPSSRPLNSFRAPYFLRCAKISAPKPTVSKPNESLKAFGLREDGSAIDTLALETRLGRDPSNFKFKMPV